MAMQLNPILDLPTSGLDRYVIVSHGISLCGCLKLGLAVC